MTNSELQMMSMPAAYLAISQQIKAISAPNAEEPYKSVDSLVNVRDWESFCAFATQSWQSFSGLRLAEKILFGYAQLSDSDQKLARACQWRLTPQQIKSGVTDEFLYYLDFDALKAIFDRYDAAVNQAGGYQRFIEQERKLPYSEGFKSSVYGRYDAGENNKKRGGEFSSGTICEISEHAGQLFATEAMHRIKLNAFQEYPLPLGESLRLVNTGLGLPNLKSIGNGEASVLLTELLAGRDIDRSETNHWSLDLGITAIDPLQARNFQHVRWLYLKNLKEIDAETAEALAKNTNDGFLELGVLSIDENVAESIAREQYNGTLKLSKLKTIDSKSAMALSSIKKLELNSLTSLDPLALEFLAKIPRLEIRLPELTAAHASALVNGRKQAKNIRSIDEIKITTDHVSKEAAIRLKDFSGGTLRSSSGTKFAPGALNCLLSNKSIDVYSGKLSLFQKIRFSRW